MICGTCLQETGDVTAHSCPGPPRGTIPPFDTRRELGQLEAVAEAMIREIVREEIETWARKQLGIEGGVP